MRNHEFESWQARVALEYAELTENIIKLEDHFSRPASTQNSVQQMHTELMQKQLKAMQDYRQALFERLYYCGGTKLIK